MAVTPAGAEVSQAVATNWKKIWKQKLRPLADRRYYTKAQSDSKYQPKGSYETAGSGYSKAESDAKYSAAGSSYSKAESDAKYAPYPATLRGAFSMMGGGAAGTYVSTEIEFGQTLSAAPTVNFIDQGGAPTAACPGTAASPQATAGNLCIYAFGNNGLSGFVIKDVQNNNGKASPFGAVLFATTSSAANAYIYGSWAVKPLALASGTAGRVAPSQGAASTDPTDGP